MQTLLKNRLFPLSLLAALLIIAQGCAVNPATGTREISLVSEAQEIQMGQQADPAATAQFGGLYPDDGLQNYVSSLGHSLAAASERPDLPWSFKLVNHELINAFALPGGFIYITRGILANMNSEAELVGVLGHEIGHVTARHSAQQITQQQLGMIGFIGGAILSETVRNNADAVMQGLQLLTLKYGREDEAQADELGFRYMLRTQHDPAGISSVMRMLQSTSPNAEEMGVPAWMLSHPDPGDRVAANERRISRSGQDFSNYRLGRNEFMQRLDGLIYGEDPRQGYFIERRFIQPELSFELTFPSGWATQNSPQSVQGISNAKDAVLQLSIAQVESPAAAMSRFTQQQGLIINQTDRRRLNGLDVSWADFTVNPPQGQQGQSVRGYVLYASHGEIVYQIIGYTPSERWSNYEPILVESIGSFAPLRDSRLRDVSPHRFKIVTLPRDMTGREFLSRYPSTVDDNDVLLANQITANQRLEQGKLMKQMVGGRPASR